MTIQSTDDRELSMKMGDEILSKLLDKSDVLELDEHTLAEHLLFFREVYMDSVFPILNSAELPPYI